MIDYQRQNAASRTLTLDLVDYPGEWLLDLPLLNKSYEQWAAESLALSRREPRARLAGAWHAHLATLDPRGREDEQATLIAARLFTDYLRACRDERFAMSLRRTAAPDAGNLAGSPAHTFGRSDGAGDGTAPDGSVVDYAAALRCQTRPVGRPIFLNTSTLLDRQIVWSMRSRLKRPPRR